MLSTNYCITLVSSSHLKRGAADSSAIINRVTVHFVSI